jgi:ELWxxDGT repeat protein
MFFIVGNGKTGTELWESDGNEGGTITVKTLTDLTIYAEAVEKANPLDHFIPGFCLHQSTQNHT